MPLPRSSPFPRFTHERLAVHPWDAPAVVRRADRSAFQVIERRGAGDQLLGPPLIHPSRGTVWWSTGDRVTKTVSGTPVDITGYQVIVTKEVEDDPNGFLRPTYDVHVPPNETSPPVPRRFLQSNAVYELEVLALEVSGNQTIRVGFFKTS